MKPTCQIIFMYLRVIIILFINIKITTKIIMASMASDINKQLIFFRQFPQA